MADRFRDRERSRPAPYNVDVLGRRPGGNKSPPFNRVFISNIPYEEKWQTLKDLFRDEVGEVTYVELMTDEQGKSKGYGIVEFKTKEIAQQAVDKMKGHKLGDRNLVVKEDFFGDNLSKALRRDANSKHPPSDPGFRMSQMSVPAQGIPPLRDIGHSSRRDVGHPSLLPPEPRDPPRLSERNAPASVDRLLDITGGAPLGRTVFVANLDYSVTYPKLKEVFSLAGNVMKIDLLLDNDNKSRGMANITFDTELEAVQAISMFNKQLLYDRPMVVKMDRESSLKPEKILPSGLQGIGPGLDISGISDSYGRHGDSRNGGDIPRDLYSKTSSSNPYESPFDSLSSGITKAQIGASRYTGRSSLSYDRPSVDMGSSRLDPPRYRDVPSMDRGAYEHRHSELDRDRNAYRPSGVSTKIDVSSHNSDCIVSAVNLPYSLSWKDVKELFSETGNVAFVEMKMENGKSKGQALVRYHTAEAAYNACRRLNNHEVSGRAIKVYPAAR